jgi:hypothetical protein
LSNALFQFPPAPRNAAKAKQHSVASRRFSDVMP